ncbi:MAG: hypothetical protein NZ749_14545 [bacterium]|nr:hypothetical protein [bacterium]
MNGVEARHEDRSLHRQRVVPDERSPDPSGRRLPYALQPDCGERR